MIGFQVIAQSDIRIQRIVLGIAHLFVPIKIERNAEAPVFGQKLAQLEVKGRLQLHSVDQLQRGGFLFKITEARRAIGSVEGEVAKIGQIGTCQSHSGNTASVVKIGETHLVDPHNTRFGKHVVPVVKAFLLGVAHAHHNHLYLSKIGGSQNSILVAVHEFAIQQLAAI